MSEEARWAVQAVVALGRALRTDGLGICVDQELVLCQALAHVDVRRRERVYWAARCAFVQRPDDVPAFDRAFERFWHGLPPAPVQAIAEHGESDPRMHGPQHGGESLPAYRQEGRSAQILDGQAARATREIPSAAPDPEGLAPRERRGLLAAYSPDELLTPPEPLAYRREELAAIRRLAEDLRRAAPERRSRRQRPAARRRGRLDLRRTVARSLATAGEPVRPQFVSHTRRPRRLVLVCDVSGSMERYSRDLLAALEGFVASGVRAETFAFATRLTRLTPQLAGRDAAAALERARAAVNDWSGGTRIGAALAELNRVHGRRGVTRGAIVIVVSDGWDRGDPAALAREARRLSLNCRRLVWINPRPTDVAGQPLALGLRAARPFVDDYVPGNDRAALERLGKLIGGLGAGRPARRQRALTLAGG